jgi:hypothetical protein
MGQAQAEVEWQYFIQVVASRLVAPIDDLSKVLIGNK